MRQILSLHNYYHTRCLNSGKSKTDAALFLSTYFDDTALRRNLNHINFYCCYHSKTANERANPNFLSGNTKTDHPSSFRSLHYLCCLKINSRVDNSDMTLV